MTSAALEWKELAPGVVINAAAWTEQAERVLTPGAVSLIASLHGASATDVEDVRPELAGALGDTGGFLAGEDEHAKTEPRVLGPGDLADA